jgi:hypothetical protein
MEEFWGLIGGIFLIVIIWSAGSYLYDNYAGQPFKEVSGEVQYSDCREQITLSKDDYSKETGTFICNDAKTISGKSMGGECVKTIMDSGGKCQTADVYEKPAEETCGSNSSLTANDKCSCNYGYVMQGGSCISNDESCHDSFGINSHGSAYGDYSTATTSTCYCNSGYMWNSDRTSCIAY